MTAEKIFETPKSEGIKPKKEYSEKELEGLATLFERSSSLTTEGKRQSELARSFKTNVEDVLIALRLFQIGISYTTQDMRDEAARLKGSYMDLREIVLADFPESTNPLWLKVLNAMGISNIVSPTGIDFDQTTPSSI